MSTPTPARPTCINCGTDLADGDRTDDCHRDLLPVCARCIAEEAHDFDAEPGAVFNRDGSLTP